MKKSTARVLLATFGSYGDVQPMIGLGSELQRHGATATVLTNGYFESAVRAAGLDFVAVTDAAEYEAITLNQDLWHPRRGLELVARAWANLLPPVYEAILQNYQPGETVVVATAVTFAARVAQEKAGVPLATVHIQPAMFRSLFEMPRLPMMPPTEWLPRFGKRLLYWLGDRVFDGAIAGDVNAFRAQFGLRPIRRILQEWSLSPQLVVGLFPDWFAAPQPDWPRQSLLSGFPLYDGDDGSELPGNAQRFLDAGDAPIAFTPGSAMRQGQPFFAAAAEACRLLGRRGILLTRYPEQVPAELPEGVVHFDYLPFGRLLPRCAALVHHGGAGTTAQGFAAGIPQLIMPMAFDQPDNAARAVRLGVARTISRRSFHPRAVSRLLRQLIEEPAIAERCQQLSGRCRDPHRFARVCEAILQLATTGTTTARAQ
jgi:UDP:flavonoid glycosyltransferase YjiC (YdhE family)